MKKWKYGVCDLGREVGPAQANHLNCWGTDGWELVCVSDGFAYFRIKSDEKDGNTIVSGPILKKGKP